MDLRGEIACVEARIVFSVQTCAMADQESRRPGLIRSYAFHQSRFAFGVRCIDRYVTIQQLQDFGGAARGSGRAQPIDIRGKFAHRLGHIRA